MNLPNRKSPMPQLARRTLAGALGMALACAGASAQRGALTEMDAPQFVEDAESMDAMDLVDRRNRERMHPSRPLEIVGLGSDGNNFRSGLNAASRGLYRPATVDRSELHARQIAMYEAGTHYSAGLGRVMTAPDAAVKAPQAPEGRNQEEEEPRSTAWVGMLMAAASSLAYFVTKSRAAA